jgi:hypothetical protein
MADQAGRHAGTHYVQFRQDGQGSVGRAGRQGGLSKLAGRAVQAGMGRQSS